MRRATRRRNDKDVVVAVPVRRECDPASVRRESREVLARQVVRQALNVCPVFIGDPDIAEITERHLSGVIVGMASQPYSGAIRGCAAKSKYDQSNDRSDEDNSSNH